MNKADSNVKIYACNSATSNSIQLMNNTKSIDTGATNSDLNTKINAVKHNMMMCPAVMFANKRIISAKGLEITPISSIGANKNRIGIGTPGIQNICCQYALLADMFVINIVKTESTKVTAIFPVTFAPPPGGIGSKPKRLFIHIKKNTVKR